MYSRKRIPTSPRALRLESLEQRWLCVASLDVQGSINTVDADSPPGIILEEGTSVTTGYKVTNTGNETLTDVSVVDDNGTISADDDIVPQPNLTTQQPFGSSLGTHSYGSAYNFAMHPTLPYMYVGVKGVKSGENKLLVFNTQTLNVTTVNMSFVEAQFLAFSNDGSKLYMGTLGGGFNMSVMATSTNTLLPPVDGWAYKGLNVGADGRLLVHGIGSIEQVSPINGTEVAPPIDLPGSDFYYGFSQISPDKTRLYYLSESPSRSTFNQLDLTTDPPTRLFRLETDRIGQDIAVTSDSAYVSIIADGVLEGLSGVPKYRTSDMSLVGTFNTGGLAKEITYSPDGQVAYIVSATGKIGIWDANTFQKVGEIPIADGEPFELQVDASGKYLFVSVDGATDSVQIYSTGRGGVHNVGDLNGNLKLDPGEAWTYRGSTTARSGANVLTATAKAKAAGNVQISDIDPTHYLVYPTWEASGNVSERISASVIGAIPSHPWTGGWNAADSRFEIVQGSLRLRAGQYLTAAADDGVVVEVYTAEATPKRLGEYTIHVATNETPWTRQTVARDVDGDDVIAPIDALIIINYLNSIGAGQLPAARAANEWRFMDVDADGYCAPIDALIVINYINAHPALAASGAVESPEGEAVSAAVGSPVASNLETELLVALLASDRFEATSKERRAASLRSAD